MKKLGRIISIIILILSFIYILFLTSQVKANDTGYIPGFTEPTKITCTCYCDTGITASGKETRPGIIAGKREYLGKVAILYAVNEDGSIGELIGIYEFLDTGAGIDTDGDGYGDSIKKGLSVDVYQPSLEAAKEWVDTYGDYVYIQIVDAEG